MGSFLSHAIKRHDGRSGPKVQGHHKVTGIEIMHGARNSKSIRSTQINLVLTVCCPMVHDRHDTSRFWTGIIRRTVVWIIQ